MLLWGAAGIAAGFVLLTIVVIVLPKDVFSKPRRGKGVGMVLRNVLGWLMIVGGVVLSMPLVPGPGFVLILAGVAIVDFPGRRKLLRKALARPGVRKKLNGFRKLLHRPPFQMPAGA